MELKRFILATAGHVDHGKSALVRALTGSHPDRLPEEKLRGITIELGFAHRIVLAQQQRIDQSDGAHRIAGALGATPAAGAGCAG